MSTLLTSCNNETPYGRRRRSVTGQATAAHWLPVRRDVESVGRGHKSTQSRRRRRRRRSAARKAINETASTTAAQLTLNVLQVSTRRRLTRTQPRHRLTIARPTSLFFPRPAHGPPDPGRHSKSSALVHRCLRFHNEVHTIIQQETRRHRD